MTKRKPPELKKKPGRKPGNPGNKGQNPGFPAPEPEIEGKSKMGRPPKLSNTPETVDKVKALARINCTDVEAAGVLGVHVATLRTFFEAHPDVKDIWDAAQAEGKMSLRRAQFKKALEGNPEMLKWLGRQLLGQQDKTTVEQTGPNGGPIATASEVKLDPATAARLLDLLE